MNERRRDSIPVDVAIVGASPAGVLGNPPQANCAVAKRCCSRKGARKSAAHIMSGAIVDSIACDRLLPGWRDGADCLSERRSLTKRCCR